MSEVHIRTQGRAGRITLTRPEALNALSYEMSLAILDALDSWADDDGVALVILDAEGGRAFCAGGDLARIHADATGNKGRETVEFWRHEYELNDRIATYRKPVVVFMQGFVMGGGVGLAGHASHRIAGETTQIAMPECTIGLIPDVGGSFLLSRAPGRMGEFLGLTGARMGAADALRAGFADLHIPEAQWATLKSDLCETGSTDGLANKATTAMDGPLATAQAMIDRAFSADDVPSIAAALETEEGDVAEAARKALGRNSPLAMHTSLRVIRRARAFETVRQAIALEFRAAARSLLEGDFVEGIRAQIIDKDRTPRWRHASLDAVKEADVDAMLRPFDDRTQDFEEIPL